MPNKYLVTPIYTQWHGVPGIMKTHAPKIVAALRKVLCVECDDAVTMADHRVVRIGAYTADTPDLRLEISLLQGMMEITSQTVPTIIAELTKAVPSLGSISIEVSLGSSARVRASIGDSAQG